MIDPAGFADLRSFIKRRISYARYRVGNVFTKASLSDVAILENGTVRAQLVIAPEETITVNRVELWNSAGELWAHQDCDITIAAGQTGILYWFDFNIIEEEG